MTDNIHPLIRRKDAKAESGDDSGESDEPITPVLADKLLTRSDLRNLPDPMPLIDNTLDLGTIALLYGKWGTAKTFIALDWAASVATGQSWQGRTTEQRRVLYVVGEGVRGFKDRVAAWESDWQTNIKDEQLSWLPEPVNLTNTAEVNQLRALIDWGSYDFIVLDTLARCMVGADENSAKDGGLVVDAMTKLLASTPEGRGLVLGVHHAGKDGKTLRGTSALESGVDTVYFASREEDTPLIKLDREKRKDGPEPDSHLFTLDPIEGTESCVISKGSVHFGGGQTSRGKQLLSTFVQCFGETGATKTELKNASDLSTGTFYRALSDLVKSGQLVNQGSPKRPHYRLG